MVIRRGLLVIVAALLGSLGCVGAPPAGPVEQASGADSVASKVITLTAAKATGWPRDADDYESTVRVVSQDDNQVTMTGDLVVFPEVHYEIELDIDESFNYWLNTDIEMIVLHRARGTSDPWKSVTCGDESKSDRTLNGYAFFGDDLTIDVRNQVIKSYDWLDEETDFADCGIEETSPEFAVFAAPSWNFYNMADNYAYELNAKCDLHTCDNPNKGYANPRFYNNEMIVVTNNSDTAITGISTGPVGNPAYRNVGASSARGQSLLPQGESIEAGEHRAFPMVPGEYHLLAMGEQGQRLLGVRSIKVGAAPVALAVGGIYVGSDPTIVLRNRSAEPLCKVVLGTGEAGESGASWLGANERIEPGALRYWDMTNFRDLYYVWAYDCRGNLVAAYGSIDTTAGGWQITAP